MADPVDFGNIDKRTEKWEMRIAEATKNKIEKMSPHFKRLMVQRILLVMDQTIYESEYVPGKNLTSE